MLRMTIFFLVAILIKPAYGEEAFSVDVERIKQIAIDAALHEHPELLPGDLADESDEMISIICLPRDLFYKCHANITFEILSTKKVDIVHEGDSCSQRTETKFVSVAVLPDGSISRVYSSGTGQSEEPIDCPLI